MRIAPELDMWFAEYAAGAGCTVHAAMVEALEAFRRTADCGKPRSAAGAGAGGTTTRTSQRKPPQTKPAPAANPCQHTRAKRMKLMRCPDCTAFLG